MTGKTRMNGTTGKTRMTGMNEIAGMYWDN